MLLLDEVRKTRSCLFLLTGFYSKNNFCSSSLLVKLYIKKCAGFGVLMNTQCTNLGDLAGLFIA